MPLQPHNPPRPLYGYICMECSWYTPPGLLDRALGQVHVHVHETQHIVKAGADV